MGRGRRAKKIFDPIDSSLDFKNYDKNVLKRCYEIKSCDKLYSKKRCLRGSDYSVLFNNSVFASKRPDKLIVQVFDSLLNDVLENEKNPPLRLGVKISTNSFCFHVPERSLLQNSSEALGVAFQKCARSAFSVDVDQQFRLNVFAIWSPEGASNPTDNLCMFKAILQGIFYYKLNSISYRFFLETDEFQKLVMNFPKTLKINPNKEFYDLKDLKKIQMFLNCRYGIKKFRLVVFSNESFNNIIYRGGPHLAKYQIYLLLNNKHFKFIEHPHLLKKNAKGFCSSCLVFLCDRHIHNKVCKSFCSKCHRFGSKKFPCRSNNTFEGKKCNDCGYFFVNEDCFTTHKLTKNINANQNDHRTTREFKSICEINNKNREKRENFYIKCSKCKRVHGGDQKYCIISPLPENYSFSKKLVRFIFFDIETAQQRSINVNGNSKIVHDVILLMSSVSCEFCMQIDGENSLCEICGPMEARIKTFGKPSYKEPGEAFINYLLKTGRKDLKTIVISHNGGLFDNHFLVQALVRLGYGFHIISNGLKIFTLEIKGNNTRNTVFKDSYNFFMSPLSTLPKTFSLDVLEKPFFPYSFISEENLFIELPHLPDLKYYNPDDMPKEKRADLINWHSKNYIQRFVLYEQLILYCFNDILILKLSAKKFIQLFKKNLNICPFTSSSTCAKLALLVFRTKFLKDNILYNAPEKGYREGELQSIEGLKFFLFVNKLFPNLKIRSAASGEGEKKFGNMKVDGYIVNPQTNEEIVIEYQGCRFHGCMYCFRNRDLEILGEKTADELYSETQTRAHILKTDFNFIVKQVWACRFKSFLKKNKNLKIIYDNIKVVEPMNLRKHVLRGGRVEPFCCSSSVEGREDTHELIYVDIVSLCKI